MTKKIKNKAGRKPLPENKKKKTISVVLQQKTISSLINDAKIGKAETHTRMAAKIIEKHYKKIEEREKNKAQEENMTNKKAA